jgi:hypothetical protein
MRQRPFDGRRRGGLRTSTLAPYGVWSSTRGGTHVCMPRSPRWALGTPSSGMRRCGSIATSSGSISRTDACHLSSAMSSAMAPRFLRATGRSRSSPAGERGWYRCLRRCGSTLARSCSTMPAVLGTALCWRWNFAALATSVVPAARSSWRGPRRSEGRGRPVCAQVGAGPPNARACASARITPISARLDRKGARTLVPSTQGSDSGTWLVDPAPGSEVPILLMATIHGIFDMWNRQALARAPICRGSASS